MTFAIRRRTRPTPLMTLFSIFQFQNTLKGLKTVFLGQKTAARLAYSFMEGETPPKCLKCFPFIPSPLM